MIGRVVGYGASITSNGRAGIVSAGSGGLRRCFTCASLFARDAFCLAVHVSKTPGDAADVARLTGFV
jgi:hypothetical protein